MPLTLLFTINILTLLLLLQQKQKANAIIKKIVYNKTKTKENISLLSKQMNYK